MAHIYSNHRTQEGDIIPIAEMEDSHLIDNINLFLRDIISAKELLTSDIAFDPIRGSVTNINSDELKHEAKALINRRLTMMSVYISEAAIRDLIGEFYELLTTAIGRDKKATPILTVKDISLLTGTSNHTEVYLESDQTIDIDF